MLDVFKRGDGKRKKNEESSLFDVADEFSESLKEQRRKEITRFNRPNLYAGSNYPTLMDNKKAMAAIGAGAALSAGALSYWLYRKSPEKVRVSNFRESLMRRRRG